jgi:hypothetical protein
MEQVLTFILQNYGSLGLVLIVVGGLSWLVIKELRKSNEALINKQQSMNDDLTNAIAKSITGLSEKLTDDLRSQNKQLIDHLINQEEEKTFKHNRQMLDRLSITREVNEIISDLRIELGSSRVCVIEFHNSLYNPTGFPFLKFTVTYEKMSKGRKTISQNYQGAQFSSIAEIADYVLESDNHIYEIHSHEEIDDIVPIMLYDGRTDIDGVLFKGLFNTENNSLIGLLVIEFDKEIPEDYSKTSIISSARTVSELITLSKEENNGNF